MVICTQQIVINVICSNTIHTYFLSIFGWGIRVQLSWDVCFKYITRILQTRAGSSTEAPVVGPLEDHTDVDGFEQHMGCREMHLIGSLAAGHRTSSAVCHVHYSIFIHQVRGRISASQTEVTIKCNLIMDLLSYPTAHWLVTSKSQTISTEARGGRSTQLQIPKKRDHEDQLWNLLMYEYGTDWTSVEA